MLLPDVFCFAKRRLPLYYYYLLLYFGSFLLLLLQNLSLLLRSLKTRFFAWESVSSVEPDCLLAGQSIYSHILDLLYAYKLIILSSQHPIVEYPIHYCFTPIS